MVAIIIVGVLAGVAIDSLTNVDNVSRVEETRHELDQLAWAIAGNPELVSGGQRVDYGYVGDVGSLPGSLADLVTRPGGYGTWDGPYIRDDFYSSAGGSESEYGYDAWGANYGFTGTTVVSSGSGSNITRRVANSADDLLYNPVSLLVLNLNYMPPGPVYQDSIRATITFPRSGGATTRSSLTAANGLVQFDSIPIGQHRVELEYIPTVDTFVCYLAINPGSHTYLEMQLNRSSW